MKTRPALLTVAIYAALSPVGFALAAQATDPPYLSQFPTVERVKAEIKGSDPVDTSARQAGALWQLQEVVKALAGPRFQNSFGLTRDEDNLTRQYFLAWQRFGYRENEPPAQDKPRWYKLREFYQNDPGFRDELLGRFFPPELRAAYDRATGKQPPQPAPTQPTAKAPPASPAKTTSATDYFSQGMEYYSRGEYAKATEAFRQGFTLDPSEFGTWVDTFAMTCVRSVDEGRYDLAVPACKQALALTQEEARIRSAPSYDAPDWKASRILLFLGDAYSGMRQYGQAVAAYRESIRLKPDDAEAQYGLGLAHLAAGRKDEALQAYRTLQRLDRKKAQELYAKINEGPGAQQAAKGGDTASRPATGAQRPPRRGEATQAAPGTTSTPSRPSVSAAGSAEAYVAVAEGNKYREAGDHAKAIEAYKKAIALNSGIGDAYFGLGLSFFLLDQEQNALPAFREAIRLKPDQAGYHLMLGATYYSLKQYEQALSSLQQAVRLKPDLAEAHSLIGQVYADGFKQYEKAIMKHREAIRLKPDDADAHDGLGKAYFSLKDYTNAVAAFRQAIRLKPDYADAHYYLGFTYLRMGRKQEALQAYRTLLTLDRQKAQELYAEINKQK